MPPRYENKSPPCKSGELRSTEKNWRGNPFGPGGGPEGEGKRGGEKEVLDHAGGEFPEVDIPDPQASEITAIRVFQTASLNWILFWHDPKAFL